MLTSDTAWTTRQAALSTRSPPLSWRRPQRLALDHVATRLRCSKSSLYSPAGSREHLLRIVIVEFFRTATDRVEAAVTQKLDACDRIAI